MQIDSPDICTMVCADIGKDWEAGPYVGEGAATFPRGRKGLAWPRWEMLPSSRAAQALWAAAHIAAYITE